MYKPWMEYLSPDGDEGSGGSAPPAPTPAPAPAPVTDDDEDDDPPGSGSNTGTAQILEAFNAALQRANNNGVQFAEQLYRENFQLRERRRALSKELNQLRARAPEGSVVLSGEEATAYQTYQQLGKPGDLQAALEERQRISAELTTLQRSGLLRQVADATGYVYEVLKTLDKPELEFEIEPTDTGPVAYVAYPTGQDNAKERKPLAEYAATHWKAFIPSLQPQGAPKVTPYPSQRLDDKDKKRDVASTMIEKSYAQQLKREKSATK